MASSPSSSSGSRAGTPSQLLTPRTKIRALLATVESSDEENGVSRIYDMNNSLHHHINGSDLSLSNQTSHQRVEEGDESDIEVRPRGRLTSRIQGVTIPGNTANTETARDRVKKMLQQENIEGTTETRGQETADDDDADDELLVPSRRLKRRALKEYTPNTEQAPQLGSPGLFVSSPLGPSPSKSIPGFQDSESDNDLPEVKSDRFKALIERKRRERLAREAVEEAKKTEQRAKQEKLASELEQLVSDDDDNVSNITDDEGGRKLTQQARPTRKAGKKAIEEMNRETQRLARGMQLSHEAKIRKKISKANLFERFNYRPAGGLEPKSEPKTSSSSRPTTPQTDTEMKDVDTPPSSPPVVTKQTIDETTRHLDATLGSGDDEELLLLDDVTSSMPLKIDSDKGKATSTDCNAVHGAVERSQRRIRIKLPELTAHVIRLDSDEELEITTTAKTKLDAVFDSIPARKSREPHSLQALRALAQVKSPGKEKRKAEHAGMTAIELQSYLHQKARQQAKQERDKRLDTMKAQGIVVQTVEERERQMQEVEDIVARAREEAEQIMQQERAAAKKDGKSEADPLAWDDSDDEEYKDSAQESDNAPSEIELSGSEDEDVYGEGSGEEEDGKSVVGGGLIDGEADETESEASQDEDADEFPISKQRHFRNKMTILSDDEGEIDAGTTPKAKTIVQMSPAPHTDPPSAPMSVLRSAKKTFIPGFPVQGPAGLGLTQIFAGTMDDSQPKSTGMPTQSMMPDFDHFPDSNFSATMDEPVDDMIVDSQPQDTQKTTQGVHLSLSQSQMRGLDSLLRDDQYTQISQAIELTQDGGLQEHTPLKERFVEPPISTVETVKMDQTEDAPSDSPLVRRSRLRRKMDVSRAGLDDESESTGQPETNTSFHVMMDAAQREKKTRLMEDFNRKKSKAKEMVQEQAEESEDEYAGLGGADGEDSDNESAASLQDIIDDAAGNNVDEGKIAAYYADRERASDEKEVEKLFKDITTGMLRRKRGADYDLSDSDDGGEARRRMKRRQFSKMQKALFADERVKKIAENPGNQAFLRTLEDRNSDDEMDFLEILEGSSKEDSQSQSQPQTQEDETERLQHTIPDSQPRKPLGTTVENRAPAYLRRTKDGKKPSNIGEVRETLSSLLDEPQGSVIPATEIGSDSDEEDRPSSARNKENQAPNPRRTGAAVVDRISLKRSGSSTSSASSRLAFAASASASSFKVPALLRRATTNSTMIGSNSSEASSSAAATSAGGFGDEAKIKRTAGKMSGVHGFARENERRAKIKEGERRKQERRARGAEKRVGLVGGLLGKGSFE